jgi:hypothetical protein
MGVFDAVINFLISLLPEKWQRISDQASLAFIILILVVMLGLIAWVNL